MAELEKAFKKSYNICREHPAVFLPYILRGILNIFIAILLVFSIILTLGIDVSSLSSFNLENERELSLFLAYLKSALTPGAVFFILFGAVVAVLLFVLVNSAAEGATINYAKQIIKNEGKPSIPEGAKKYTFSLFGYTLFISLLNLFVALVFLLFIVLLSLLIPAAAVFLSFFTVFLLIFALAVLNLGAIFSPQFIVGEDRGVVSGFRESLSFVLSNFFSVFLYIVVAVFAFGAFAISAGVLSFLSEAVFNFAPFLKAFTSFIMQIFSFLAGAALTTYFDAAKTALVLERAAGESAG